ncbi:MAG: hypothetical protein NT038_10790 [Euryarchaeota archaeon]|nr:hypothetical protein [Euryarchaeota archaeon]
MKELDWRVNTGIDELDYYIDGGFPKNRFIVVTGDVGTGRTIFSYQYLWAGLKNDEKCLLIATDRPADGIISQAIQFKWNFDKMMEEDMLKIHYIDTKTLCEWKAIDEIEHLLEKDHYDRMMLDNLSSIACGPLSPFNIITLTEWGWQRLPFYDIAMKNIEHIIRLCKKNEVTTVAISQKYHERTGDTFDTISDRKSDGLIVLNKEQIDRVTNRILEIKKLRFTNLKIARHEFRIAEKGITFTDERPAVDIFIKDKRLR